MTRWRAAVAAWLALVVVAGALVGPLVVGFAMIAVTAVLSWTFVVMYHRAVNWWESAIGVQVMSFAVLFGLLTTISLFPLDQIGAWGSWLSLAVLTAMPVIMANLIRVFLHVRRAVAKEKESNHE